MATNMKEGDECFVRYRGKIIKCEFLQHDGPYDYVYYFDEGRQEYITLWVAIDGKPRPWGLIRYVCKNNDNQEK